MPGPDGEPIRWRRTPQAVQFAKLHSPDCPVCFRYQANHILPRHRVHGTNRILMVHRVPGPIILKVKIFQPLKWSAPNTYYTWPGDFEWVGNVQHLPVGWRTPGMTVTGWFFDPYHGPALLRLEHDGRVTASPTWWQGARWLTFWHADTTSSWVLILGGEPLGVFLLRELHRGVWRDMYMHFMFVAQDVRPMPLSHDDMPPHPNTVTESFCWFPWGKAPEIVHVQADRTVGWCNQGEGYKCRFKGWARRKQRDPAVLGFRFKPHDGRADPEGRSCSAVLRQFGDHCWSVIGTLTAGDDVHEHPDLWSSQPSIYAVAIHAEPIGGSHA